jgi:Thoeris protein ThsB, TIR-like domain
MARRTFFSFHYERDVWRAGQVRNSWVTKDDREAAGFWDSAKWEEVKKKGADAIHGWIDEQLKGTSVTVVLIGAETSTRKYVDYEIAESHKKRNGMLGVYIHNMKDSNGKTDTKGANPFGNWTFKDADGNVITYPTVRRQLYLPLATFISSGLWPSSVVHRRAV